MPSLDLLTILTRQCQCRFHRVADLAAVEVFVGPVIPGMPCEDPPVVFGEMLQIFDEVVPDLPPVLDGEWV